MVTAVMHQSIANYQFCNAIALYRILEVLVVRHALSHLYSHLSYNNYLIINIMYSSLAGHHREIRASLNVYLPLKGGSSAIVCRLQFRG